MTGLSTTEQAASPGGTPAVKSRTTFVEGLRRHASWSLFLGFLALIALVLLAIGYYSTMIDAKAAGSTRFAEVSYQLLLTLFSGAVSIFITLHFDQQRTKRSIAETATRSTDQLAMLARAISDTGEFCQNHVPTDHRDAVVRLFKQLADMTETAKQNWIHHAGEYYDFEKRALQRKQWLDDARSNGEAVAADRVVLDVGSLRPQQVVQPGQPFPSA